MSNICKIFLSKKALLILSFLAIVTILFSPTNASALSRSYFDDAGDEAGECDLGKPSYNDSNYQNSYCDQDHRVVLLAGENNKVPEERTVLQANFKNNSITEPPRGQSLIIRGAHLCAGSSGAVLANQRDAVINGYYSDNTNDTPNTKKIEDDKLYGKKVTDYKIGTQTREGIFRKPNAADCGVDSNITVNLSDRDFTPVDTVKAPGWWFVKIVVTHVNQHGRDNPNECTVRSNPLRGDLPGSGPCDGLVNSFRISAVGDNSRSVTTYSTNQACDRGECVTLRSAFGESNDDYFQHLTFKLRFGASCSVPDTGERARMHFFDLDYGDNTDGGKHVVKVTVRGEWPERDADGNLVTNPDGSPRIITRWLYPDGQDDDTLLNWRQDQPTYRQAYAIPSRDGGVSGASFYAWPDAKYTAFIMNFGPHLAFQAGLPYDGVYYGIDCGNPTAKAVPHAELNKRDSYEPNETAAGTTYVTNDTPITARAKWERTFWYEEGSNDDYDSGVDTPIPSGMASPGTLTDFPPGVDSIRRTNSTTVNGARKRICVALRLYDPTPSTTIVRRAVDCVNIERKPYFKVTNGDVNASAAWAPDCTTSNGRISAFNREERAGVFKGSSTDIAAFSWQRIIDFASGDPAKGLTFANTGNPAATTNYGGGFRQVYCIPDELNGVTDNANINTNCAVTLDRITNGNVFISGSGDCSIINTVNVGSVPNLRKVVAGGDIYIGKNLTNLDGIFIAKGNIYTCSELSSDPREFAIPVPVSRMFTECDKTLKVRGALVAGGVVKFQRTSGSLLQSEAETIEYNPFIWLSTINPPAGGGASTDQFDYITALPPVL